MKLGSLCTGYGGLDLAAHMLIPDLEMEWMSEIDPAADAVIDERFDAVNLGDFTKYANIAPVDVITAGFPCQPFSTAGAKRGVEDERWIWDDIQTAIGRMDPPPRLLLLENVAGLLTANDGHAMARVVEGLAAIGYLGSWRTLRASDVGACHRRTRVFFAAVHADRTVPAFDHRTVTVRPGIDRLLPTPAAWDGYRGPDLARAGRRDSGGMDLVTTIERLLPTPTAQAGRHGATKDVTANAHGYNLWDVPHHPDSFGPYRDAIERHMQMTIRQPPPPTINGNLLNPQFVEWMMMLPAGWVTGIEGLSRAQQLKILGNGVVPLQAAIAFESLLEGMT